MLILNLIGLYLLAGVVFGAAFLLRGYAAIAPEARGAGVGARLLWTPAAVALWPLLVAKWLGKRRANAAAGALK